jgi:putative transcriptional regulator
MSRLYEDIKQGLEEAIAFEKGDPDIVSGSVVHKMKVLPVPDFSPGEIREIRLKSAMTQSVFAACIGVTKKAVESWEGGRSHPDGAARRTLSLMSRNPHFAEVNGILE